MKKNLVILFPGLLLSISLMAQNQEPIIVKAGTTLRDYFTVAERYLYPEFTTGRVYFKTNSFSERKLNYNYLAGEVEYIEKSDTLSIINKKDIGSIIIAQDTFIYDMGYILQVKSGSPKIGLKEFIEFQEIQKKDPYGLASSGGSSISYNSMPAEGNYYQLRANSDMIFKRTKLYYISANENGFVLFTKKNVFQLFPEEKGNIKSYLKTNKINFDSGDDLLRLAEYLETL